jgi:hypothetical protein
MELAGQNLIHSLCPDLGYVPYWSIAVDRQYTLHLGGVSGVHNIGRVWDALLRLESATGFKIPPDVEATFLATTKRYFDNPDHMCWEPLDWAGLHPQFELHSFREHLLALNALSAYRHDAWAAETGHGMLDTLLRASRDDCSWDLGAFDYYHRTENHYTRFMDPVGSNGRMIEALVYFYRTTHGPLALELAERLARWHLANSTHADGTLNKAPGLDHTHSYMCTLRGLLLYGQLTHQGKYIEAVAQTYRHTVLGTVIRESGWNSHDFGADGAPEPASAADAAQIGMLLAENGYPEFWDDVERLVRCRLIPSQITKCPPLTVSPEDARRIHGDPAKMILGAYGGMHLEPHGGKQAVTDVTAAVLHSLVDIYRHIVTRDDRGVCINLHFDYSDPSIDIRTTRGNLAKVVIMAQYAENTLIRIPAWAPKESIRLSVGSVETALKMIGNYAFVPRRPPPYDVVLEYALPERTTSETVGGVTFKFVWRGDDIAGISPNTDFLPFYPSAPPA